MLPYQPATYDAHTQNQRQSFHALLCSYASGCNGSM